MLHVLSHGKSYFYKNKTEFHTVKSAYEIDVRKNLVRLKKQWCFKATQQRYYIVHTTYNTFIYHIHVRNTQHKILITRNSVKLL